ncbi:MAG: 30S ribosome-binding factor RbfA [Alphaproteobacteria bacterium]
MTRRHLTHRDHSPSQRQLRVAEDIRHALARILERTNFRDPLLAEASITVSEVRLSPDLRQATVYVMPLGGANQDPVVAALNHATSFLRGNLAHEVRVKFLPTLVFTLDQTFAEVSRVTELLHSPNVARDLKADPSAESEGDGTVLISGADEGNSHGA